MSWFSNLQSLWSPHMVRGFPYVGAHVSYTVTN
jgi:hypothetical protein